MLHRLGWTLCFLLPSCLTARVWEGIDDSPPPSTTARHDLTFSEIGIVTDAAVAAPYLAFHVGGSETLPIAAERPWLLCEGTAPLGVTVAALTNELELRPSSAKLVLQTSVGSHGPKLVARSVLSGRSAPSALGTVIASETSARAAGEPPTLTAAWARLTTRPWLQWITGDLGSYHYRLVAVVDAEGQPLSDLAPLDELRTGNTASTWQHLRDYTFVLAAETATGDDAVRLAIRASAARLVSVATIEHVDGEIHWSLEEHWGVSAHRSYPGSLPAPTDSMLATSDWNGEFKVRERAGRSTFWNYAEAVAMTPLALVADAAIIGAVVGIVVLLESDDDC